MWTCTWDRSELKMRKGDYNWELESIIREFSSKLLLFCVYMCMSIYVFVTIIRFVILILKVRSLY